MGTWIRRIFLSFLLLLFGFIAFLALSILIDGLLGRDRIMKLTNITIPGVDGQPEVRGYLAKPEGPGPFPAVIMVHEFFGLNESILGKATGLAEEGYVVLAPDTFRGSTTAWIPRAIYQVITTRSSQVNQDLDSVFAWLEAQPVVDPGRIAVAGFCYGGRAALAYSLHNPRTAATVVFYGSPVTDPQLLQTLSGPVLGIFGGADSSIPLSEVTAFENALNAAGVTNEITVYEAQPHAFVTSMEAVRQGGVQGQAWQQMLAFLDKYLRSGETSHGMSAPVMFELPVDLGYYLHLAFEHTFHFSMNTH